MTKGWFKPEEKAPEIPCLVYSGGDNFPNMCLGIITLTANDGEEIYFDKRFYDMTIQSKSGFNCLIPGNRIRCWMPLPKVPDWAKEE